MTDAYENSILPAMLVVAAAFIVARILAALGIATKENVGLVVKWLAILVGVTYAVFFEAVRSFGPMVDLLLRVVFGIIVGCLAWVFIAAGVGSEIQIALEEGKCHAKHRLEEMALRVYRHVHRVRNQSTGNR